MMWPRYILLQGEPPIVTSSVTRWIQDENLVTADTQWLYIDRRLILWAFIKSSVFMQLIQNIV